MMLGIVAFGLILTGALIGSGIASLSLMAGGGALAMIAVFLGVGEARARMRAESLSQQAEALIAHDPAPVFVADAMGQVLAINAAGHKRLNLASGRSLVEALSGVVINAANVAFRMETAVAEHGQVQETLFTRSGHIRLSAHRMEFGTLWRIEDRVEAPQRTGEGLALPMLTANRSGAILSMNDAMRKFLGFRARDLQAAFGEAAIETGARVTVQREDEKRQVGFVVLDIEHGLREIYLLSETAALLAEDMTGAAVSAVQSGALLDAMPVAAMLIGANGDVLSCNAAARELLRLRETGSAVSISALIEGPGRPVRDWLSDLAEDRVPNRPEVVRVLRREDDCSVKISMGNFLQEGEMRFLAVLQDATDMQFLQQQVAQSQKMQAVGELAGGVAHDFNNLLTAITGHCDLLLLRHDQGDQDYADLVQIHQNANRAASLVGQLLAFSRKQTMKLELIDLRDTMGDLTHLLNRLVGERVILKLSQDPALQPIRADRRLLDQVLMNLVVNARDAMPDGGEVRLISRMMRIDATLRRGGVDVPVGDYVVIDVIDEGIGIPPDRLGRIFEPFFTTKKVGEGTGLGLSMAYGIVKQSGGYIFADSQVGEGTRFSLYFPAHEWPREAEKPVEAPVAVRTQDGDKSGVVLLVEDEAPVRAFASRALKLKGFSVLEAGNGDEALEILEDGDLEIDLFVTDMIMPGKGGPEWVREALGQRPGVGVVFMSGYAEDAYGKFSDDIPKAVFLAKPFSLADLTETVRGQMP